MADYEQDNEDDFTVVEVNEAERRATVDVEATWQEYEDSVEFRFAAGNAKIEVTVPYDEAAYAQILVASLPQAFETAVEAYFDTVEAEEGEADDVPSGD